MSQILGLHHVTAIASDPQRNVDFYAGLLGLRLVKRTVNFDDPHSYHLYYGDEIGRPGSLLTFFPWPGARRGRVGTGQVAVTAFSIAPGSIGFWVERLLHHQVEFEPPAKRGHGADAERVIAFRDHDGLLVELVGHAAVESRPAWADAPGIPALHAVRGLHAVTLWVDAAEPTEQVLVGTLGFRPLHEEGTTRRYGVGDGGPGALVDVRAVGGFGLGADGAGTVHHVAFAVTDDVAQLAVRKRAAGARLSPTPVIDRNYFHSVYFREPGGVLFEIATNAPGFAIDEPVERLGERLMLPSEYEPLRQEIEGVLPPIHLPTSSVPPLPDETALADVTGDTTGDTTGDATGDATRRFTHRYIPPAIDDGSPTARTTLLLLHGTGGDEDDLLPLGRALLPGAGLLSPRGRVLEAGAPRFFRRLAEGVFDQEDLAHRTEELADFVEAAAATYEFPGEGIIAVGFSNGANVAASVILRRPAVLRGAVLLSPMVPFEPSTLPDLVGTGVFIGAGRSDPIAPAAQAERLAALLRRAGAEVTLHWTEGGHTITDGEVEAARQRIAHWIGAGSVAIASEARTAVGG
jgi:glyoxalase family protein